MIVAACFFAMMGVFVKLGSQSFSAVELVFWRTLFGVVLMSWAAVQQHGSLATPNLRYHIQRGLLGFASLLMYFYAITILPLSTAVTLSYTSPLFLGILSVVLLHEHLTRHTLIGLVLGFAGIILLLQPTLGDSVWYAGIVGLFAGFLAGWAYLHVKELGQRGEPSWRIVFYFSLVSALGGAILVSVFGSWHAVTTENIWLLIGLGISATIAQLTMTLAYKTGRKMLVGSLSYLTVAMSALFGYCVWGETLSLDGLLAIGLIVISGIITSHK